MRNIALIGCSAKKKGKNSPTEKYPAKDIYIGANFRKSIDVGLKHFQCEECYILSGLHGLLNPDTEISYYDCYLSKMNVSYKREWANKVWEAITSKFSSAERKNINFIFFSGQDYYKDLLPNLADDHYTVLKFNGRHITWEIKESK